MFVRIRYKLGLTILIVSILAAIPLSLYIVAKQETEKIESTIAIGRGNTKLLAKSMLDVFLKSGGDPSSMRIDAEEAIATYRDQFELGLVFGQTLMLTAKHRGLVMATLDKELINGNAGEKKTAAKPNAQARRSENDIAEFTRYENEHLGPCFNRPEERCFNFSFAAKYEKTPVVLSVMSISERHVLEPIRRLRRLIFISAGIAVIVSLLVGIGAARFITGPIAALADAVRRFSRGDLQYRVTVRVNDELRTLGDAFNDMAGQIQEKIKEIEDHRDNLELKVQERTAELRQALTQVSKLKEQQDADYYLTTFLFKPLCINRNSSRFIHTEFFLKQKKEFQFRDKHGEIGGDICITANLNFRENSGLVNRYLFATNADAMGKSIQGAGGAIVYGTAINTIIASSSANNRILETSPRDWLIRMYRELHNIFLSFEGSMLVSGTFMLLNEHNGKAFYINAEHPWTILYRNGEARFIEDELMLRKLGADIPGQPIDVKEFDFQPGDVLFMASDGRDDIILSDVGNERIINEDEKAILDIVLRGRGDLQETVQILRRSGTFSDDVSIMRIEIIGFNPEPVHTKSRLMVSGDIIRGRLKNVRDLIRSRNFAQAAENLKALSTEIDVESVPQFYVLLSRIQLHDGHLDLARDSLERALRLGDERAATYKALGNIFFKLDMKTEAVENWKRALELNPDDEQLSVLLRSISANPA